MAIAASERLVDLGNDATFGVIAVGVDRTDRADAARGSPGARARVVGRADALAAFDQRPDLAAAIEDGLQALEQTLSPGRTGAASPHIEALQLQCPKKVKHRPRVPNAGILSFALSNERWLPLRQRPRRQRL